MKMKPSAVLMVASLVTLAGCQTINSATMPSLYKVQQKLANMVTENCVVKGESTKINSANVFHVKYDQDNSGWVTAVANNAAVYVQGEVALNLYTGAWRCGGKPEGDWASLTDPIAEQLLRGSIVGSSIKPSSAVKSSKVMNSSVSERLAELQYLLDQGLITEVDAAEKRRQILESL